MSSKLPRVNTWQDEFAMLKCLAVVWLCLSWWLSWSAWAQPSAVPVIVTPGARSNAPEPTQWKPTAAPPSAPAAQMQWKATPANAPAKEPAVTARPSAAPPLTQPSVSIQVPAQPAVPIPTLTAAIAPQQQLVCPKDEAVEVVPPALVAPVLPSEEKRAVLTPSSWRDLPGWAEENLSAAWDAYNKSCDALRTQAAWRQVCTLAAAMPPRPDNALLAKFFEQNFAPYQLINVNGNDSGMITGYYEPILYGSRTRSARYRYPLYMTPDDLLVIDLSEVYPELKHKRLRGRLQGNKVVPYHARGDIELSSSPLQGKELVWIDDPVEVFFLHIQGSGRVMLDGGEQLRVGYAEQNGHPFRSVARRLIETGELPANRVSMQGIKAWARKNPDRVDEFLNQNPSYVFFKELPLDLSGPLGTLGVPLTAERSIAVDARVVPLGVPVYLSTTFPNTDRPLNRLMLAQDTGGAIAGAIRADFYWGTGDAAGRQAGVMKQNGKMWVLLPKDYNISAK